MTTDTNSGNMTEDTSNDIDSDGSTTNTGERHWLTNDGIAIGVVTSFVALTTAGSAGLLNLQTLPEYWTTAFILGFGTAMAWAFGKDAVEAWRGGGNGDE